MIPYNHQPTKVLNTAHVVNQGEHGVIFGELKDTIWKDEVFLLISMCYIYTYIYIYKIHVMSYIYIHIYIYIIHVMHMCLYIYICIYVYRFTIHI